jgi:hypothetical protein
MSRMSASVGSIKSEVSTSEGIMLPRDDQCEVARVGRHGMLAVVMASGEAD